MRGGKGVFLALALLLCWASPVGASYEWRAAWGAPYPLEISEACAMPAADRMRARVAFAHPYEVEGLRFHALFLRSPRGTWEIHGGSLSAPHLTEWHVGVGRRVALCAHAVLMCGVRCFNARIGDWQAPAAWTFTIEPGGIRVIGNVAINFYTIHFFTKDDAGQEQNGCDRREE